MTEREKYAGRSQENNLHTGNGGRFLYRFEGVQIYDRNSVPVSGLAVSKTKGELEQLMKRNGVNMQRAVDLNETNLETGIIDLHGDDD